MYTIKDYSTTTAVLLFAQSEKIESGLKPIASCSKQNVLLWKKMNGNVTKLIQKSKLPYFVSDENSQVGTTFGEKITHAIQAVFVKGFAKVIVIGNDCIELKVQHLLQAEKDLKTNDLVIGSDYSGGAYLIGISKSEFNADLFETLPWQTKGVLTALQTLYKTQSIAYLACLNDCNDAFDFKKATHKLSFSDAFRKILLSFLSINKIQNYFEIGFFSYDYHPLNFNKGSPVSSSTSV
ncbi:glycosyltransferase A (GT-A) superfamily protein (DUF2064 family) [Flavobacterium sp. CG_23.5]|uniref:TIGR04282 family arsenosugar biosynthesis glycosyltransferase n=1 Tax=Flavobacterium sp. CG_23.5 TaxID=2760708 RepID=UPI001AE46F15|nr:DUF2064 domain-containing protein [Flavobacterium sp. CG_23.5]MBP2284736.1 glycosyltransferase A (GT-A) superfamily protein (DUF2064 family) [Flavobacterium sp. CG_23.5]